MPRPAVNRPPDTRTTEEICLARSRGFARQLTLTTVEIRRMRLVHAAAAASAMSGSRLSYTRRSMTPTDSKPACSAWAAKDPICAMSAPGTAAGSPIPILMVPIIPNSRPPVLNETDTRLHPAVAAGEEANPTIAGGDRDAQGGPGRPATEVTPSRAPEQTGEDKF